MSKTKEAPVQPVSGPVPVKLSDWQQDLACLLRSRAPGLFLQTIEEQRGLEHLVSVVQWLGQNRLGTRNFLIWSGVSYQEMKLFKSSLENPEEPKSLEHKSFFETVMAFGEPEKKPGPGEAAKHQAAVLVLCDIESELKEAVNVRALRETLWAIVGTLKTLILVGKPFNLPEEIQAQFKIVPFELPTTETLHQVIKPIIDSYAQNKGYENVKGSEESIKAFARACTGLTESEAIGLSALAVAKFEKLDDRAVQLALKEKAQIVRRGNVLDYHTCEGGLSQVGGLEHVKEWLNAQAALLADPVAARKYGCVLPSGLLLLGVPGCLGKDTPIFDPVDGTVKTVLQRFEEGVPFHVVSHVNGVPVIACADVPKKFKPAPMVELELDTGEKITVTHGHAIWQGAAGYVPTSELLLQGASCRLPTISEHDLLALAPDAPRLTHIVEDSQVGYRAESRFYGAQPREEEDNGQVSFPLRVGVPALDRRCCGADGQTSKQECNRSYQQYGHRAKTNVAGQDHGFQFGTECFLSSRLGQYGFEKFAVVRQPVLATTRKGKDEQLQPAVQGSSVSGRNIPSSFSDIYRLKSETRQTCFQSASVLDLVGTNVKTELRHRVKFSAVPFVSPEWSKYTKQYVRQSRIVKATLQPSEEYYDFHVPGYNNYWACGMWHHNTGKSLISKMLAAEWKLPLLTFDVGRAFGSLVGESEANTRRMIELANATKPNVIFIDEIEKALGGGSDNDGGTTARVKSTLLTWLQEKSDEIFVVATANDLTKLESIPELIRAGRFDAQFFVDLPDLRSRIEILNIHLNKRGHNISGDDLVQVAKQTKFFSGAELEAVVKGAVTAGFRAKLPHPTGEQLIKIARETKPLATTMPEVIDKLRRWCKEGRMRPAGAMLEADSQDEQAFQDHGLPFLPPPQ